MPDLNHSCRRPTYRPTAILIEGAPNVAVVVCCACGAWQVPGPPGSYENGEWTVVTFDPEKDPVSLMPLSPLAQSLTLAHAIAYGFCMRLLSN